MKMTVTTSNQTLKAIAEAAGGDLDAKLNVNDKLNFQLKVEGSQDVYVDIGVAAAVATGMLIAQGSYFNFTARPEDVNLIADGSDNTDVRIIAEPVLEQ